jgi:hypothetical protein
MGFNILVTSGYFSNTTLTSGTYFAKVEGIPQTFKLLVLK